MIISEKSPWECPRCHKINAGWVPQCFCSLQTCGANFQINFEDTRTQTAHLDNRCYACGNYHGHGLPCATLKVE